MCFPAKHGTETINQLKTHYTHNPVNYINNAGNTFNIDLHTNSPNKSSNMHEVAHLNT